MELHSNVRINQELADKIKSGRINTIDWAKLALSNHIASLFPDCRIYTDPQQQTEKLQPKLPCIYAQIYAIHREKRLDDTAEYRMTVNLNYLARDSLSYDELDSARLLILQNLETIPNELEPYCVYETDSEIFDGVANVSGELAVWELRKEEIPLIQFAKTNVLLKKKVNNKRKGRSR